MASTTPTVNQRVDEIKEEFTDLEKSVSKMVKKAVERAMDAMRQSLADWVMESQTTVAAKKVGKNYADLSKLCYREQGGKDIEASGERTTSKEMSLNLSQSILGSPEQGAVNNYDFIHAGMELKVLEPHQVGPPIIPRLTPETNTSTMLYVPATSVTSLSPNIVEAKLFDNCSERKFVSVSSVEDLSSDNNWLDKMTKGEVNKVEKSAGNLKDGDNENEGLRGNISKIGGCLKEQELVEIGDMEMKGEKCSVEGINVGNNADLQFVEKDSNFVEVDYKEGEVERDMRLQSLIVVCDLDGKPNIVVNNNGEDKLTVGENTLVVLNKSTTFPFKPVKSIIFTIPPYLNGSPRQLTRDVSYVLSPNPNVLQIIKDPTRPTTYCGLENNSSNVGRENLLIIDPGGRELYKQLSCVINMFTETILKKEVKLDEVGMRSVMPSCGYLSRFLEMIRPYTAVICC